MSKGKCVLTMADIGEDPKEIRNNNGKGNRAHDELWLACAGRVEIPSPGESVFYFPQGHIEQIEACMNNEGDSEMPKYDLPYKMLCKVVQCDLLVEQYTDEVFVKIDLLPEAFAVQNKGESYGEGASSSAKPPAATRVFSKKLSPSDTSVHGVLVIPKSIAEQCFPPLEMSMETPAQNIVAKDLQGIEWTFRHIYRGQPKRHLFTNGWGAFVNAKKLVAGDVLLFVRGENGELYVGSRPGKKTKQYKMIAPVLSCGSMKHGLLANAYLAISTKSILTVFHRPWSLPERFVIPYDEYMKGRSWNYEVGTRIKMQHQIGEAYLGERSSMIAGSVISIEDADGFRWPGSEWRCLKVNWDGINEGMDFPVRVSPWSVEPLEISSSKKQIAIPSSEQLIEWGRGLHVHPPKQQ